MLTRAGGPLAAVSCDGGGRIAALEFSRNARKCCLPPAAKRIDDDEGENDENDELLPYS